MIEQSPDLIVSRKQSHKKVIAIAVMAIVAVGIFAFAVGQSLGNTTGYQMGESIGFTSGYENGQSAGYNSGYQKGYSDGKTLGYAQGVGTGNSSGYSYGYIQGLKDGAGTGYNIRDPSVLEMNNFLAGDVVHNNVYIDGTYVCFDFASDFANEAFNQGYRCGVVYIVFEDTLYAHSINCFKTADSGLIFIEPQIAKTVSLVAGQIYQSMGTVERYTITW